MHTDVHRNNGCPQILPSSPEKVAETERHPAFRSEEPSASPVLGSGMPRWFGGNHPLPPLLHDGGHCGAT